MTFEVKPEWLPAGWTVGNYNDDPNLVVLGRPGGGWVTIDVDKRFFASGMCVPVAVHAPLQPWYVGIGWEEGLVRRAVTWLDEAMGVLR